MKTLEFFKSVIIRVPFPINFVHKRSCIQAWSSWHCSQAMEHMLLTAAMYTSAVSGEIASDNFQKICLSRGFLVAIGCKPIAVRVQPHSSGRRSHSGSFHWIIWRNTLLLWKLAASVVGGNDFGSTWERLVATFSHYLLYRKAFKVSPLFPL